MCHVLGHPAGDKQFGELIRPAPEDGAHVIEDLSIRAGDGHGDNGAPTTEPGAVEKRSPKAEKPAEDVKRALAR
jgi:hypothetical protein